MCFEVCYCLTEASQVDDLVTIPRGPPRNLSLQGEMSDEQGSEDDIINLDCNEDMPSAEVDDLLHAMQDKEQLILELKHKVMALEKVSQAANCNGTKVCIPLLLCCLTDIRH